MSCQETSARIIVGSVLLQVNTLLLFSLVIQPFRHWNMVTGWRRARSPTAGWKRRGSPSEKQRELLSPSSSWTSTPGGALGPPTSWLSCMRCSFMLQDGGRKRWNICAAKATKAAYWNLILRQVNLPWSWWHTKCLGRK